MSQRKQYFHTGVFASMCAAFGGLAFFHLWLIFPKTGTRLNSSATALSVGFVGLATAVIAMQLWFRRRIVREFRYDGSALHIRTLGLSTMQTYLLSQVQDIREWRGRRGTLGYRLTFQDGRKAYVELAVENSTMLVERLVVDMQTTRNAV